MASAEIGAVNSSSLIEVGFELKIDEKDVPDVSSALIFRVPKPLRDSNDGLYTPQLVSIGPFHYGKEELKDMEKSKSEAVRRMQKRIQRRDPHASIKSIVEDGIVLKDKEIREFYGEHIPLFSDRELAWMVTRDACFIFEFLVNYVRDFPEGERFYMEEVAAFSWMYDPVFDATFQNPMRLKLMDDLLLFENQIPFVVLQHLLRIQMGSIDAANQRLNDLITLLVRVAIRHNAFKWSVIYSSIKYCHVLEAFYLSMGGTIDFDNYWRSGALQLKSASRNRIQIFFESGVQSVKAICGRWCKLCLRYLSSNTNPREAINLSLLKLPTAAELTRGGVKIYPVTHQEALTSEPGFSAIPWTRFDEKTSMLYLPQVNVTQHSNSVMRNIIAMELSLQKRYNPRSMTQFVLFIDELIESEEDVAVLRKAEVIHNYIGSNEQVAHHFNSLTRGIFPSEGCKVIDDVRRGLHKYRRSKYKIL